MWCAWGRGRLSITRTRATDGLAMVHENSTYDIPLRTLCSKDTPNLFVGGRLTMVTAMQAVHCVSWEPLSGQDMRPGGSGGLCAITRK